MTAPTIAPSHRRPRVTSQERTDRQHPLEVRHLTKRYGPNTVVDDLTFVVRPGRVTGFLGPNGSGKSTTMKVLLGLASADAGEATIGGLRYRDLPDPARTVGVVLEPNAFHPGRSGRNHLRIVAGAAGIPLDRVDEALTFVDLGSGVANRRVGSYSLGMKQRLSLAAALLGEPPILILDEPANGLDPQGMRTLREVLASRAANGDTILVSSHLLGEIEHLADDLVVINQGRLVTSGPIRDLQQAATLVRTTSPDHLTEGLERLGGTVARDDVNTLIVRGLAINEIGEYAHHEGVVLHELSPQTGSLEELFLAWTNNEPNPTNTEVLS